jgi:hypothetical protein
MNETIRKPRVVDPGYRAPDVQPEDYICARVYIPNDILYIAAFWGHVFMLTQWLAWERGGTKARDAAAAWKAAWELSQTAWEECNGECGIVDIRQSLSAPCILEKRIDCDTWEEFADMRLCVPRMRIRDGVIQQDTTGNGDWEDAQDPDDPYDPRTDSAAPPPWADPPVGETGDCLSAANVATYVNYAASSFATAMVDGLTFFQTLGVATTILTALLDLIPLTLLTAFITSLYQQTVDAWEDVRDFSITSKLTELMVCNYNADGSMTEAQFDALMSEVDDWIATLSDADQIAKWNLARLLMQLWGPVGMTISGQIWGITTYDCQYSECEWSHEFDFTVSSLGWTTHTPPNESGPTGTWVSGQGWVGTRVTANQKSVFIQCPNWPDSLTITSIEVYLYAGTNDNLLELWDEGDFVRVLGFDWQGGVEALVQVSQTIVLDGALRLFARSYPYPGSIEIRRVVINGVGVNPFE